MPEKSEQRPELMGEVRLDFAPVALRVGDKDEKPKMIETEKFGLLPQWTDFVASTSAENRYGSVIEQETWKLKNFHNNPVILWMHDGMRLPLGTGKARIVGKGTPECCLMVRVYWDLQKEYPQEVCDLYHRKILRAGSVRAYPGARTTWRDELDEDHPAYKKEGWGRYLRDCELGEFSAVTVPGDAGALAAAAPKTTPPAPPAPTPDPGQSMDFRLLLCTVLALSADVSDEDLQAAADAHPDNKKRAKDAEAAIRLGLSLDADADIPTDAGAQLAALGDRAGFVSLADANAMVLAAQGATDPKADALAAVKLAAEAGKITPALLSHYEALAASNPAQTVKLLAALPAGVAVPLGNQADPTKAPKVPAPQAVTLSAADKIVAKQLGMTEAEFLAARAADPTPTQEG